MPQIAVRRASDGASERSRSNRSRSRPKQTGAGGRGSHQVGPGGNKTLPAPSSKSHVPGVRNFDSNHSFRQIDGIALEWPEKRLDDSPEVALVSKKIGRGSNGRYASTFLSKLLSCIQVVFKNRVHNNAGGLTNFKPIEARTNHTMEYVERLALNYSTTAPVSLQVNSPARLDVKERDDASSVGSSFRSGDSSIGGGGGHKTRKRARKNDLLRSFYDRTYQTLRKLQRSIHAFKNIIFTLTYTRYSEDLLTESEKKMTKGKSIVGSYLWIVVHALQQIQEDPEVELMQNMSKVHSGLHDLALEFIHLLNLSFHTWNDIVLAFGAVEHVHKKTETVFHKLTVSFQNVSAPDQETANKASLHLKKYRRGDGDLDDLRNMSYDPYASLLTWKKFEQGPSRILFKTNYSDESQLWQGFDPLSSSKKVSIMRELVTYVRLILESIKESSHLIVKDLLKSTDTHHGLPNTRAINQPQRGVNINRRLTPSQIHPVEIASFEDGIDEMDSILGAKLSSVEWLAQEVMELLETDKIFLDDMDILTNGAGVTRAILHEARNQIHVCYETCRLLDLKEFSNLPSYEKVYHKIKDEAKEKEHNLHLLNPNNKKFTNKRGSVHTQPYDIEESQLELRNVAGLFRTSPYHDILVNMPVYTSRVALTLQEAEMVFTPSSEKLLTNYKSPED